MGEILGGGVLGKCGLILACVVGWNCYLSYVNSQGGKDKMEDVYEKEE